MTDIKLDRPLIFFDLETTGTVISRDRIVEISVLKIFPDGKRQVHTKLVNPEMPIPPASTAIHGISDEKVKDAPTFSMIAQNLFIYFEGCDMGGYNINRFDVPMLINEFKRAGLDFSIEGRRMIDVYNIFCKLYPRTLSAAYKFFCGKELTDAHSAEADTVATLDVFEGQLRMHPELSRNLDELHAFSDLSDPDSVDSSNRFKWVGGVVTVNFGKNSGKTLSDIALNDPGFLKWIIRSDFPDDVKGIAQNALLGKFPEKKTNEE
ncbi:MAG: 3'-5' exonuclease [Victivallaceae bacterium]